MSRVGWFITGFVGVPGQEQRMDPNDGYLDVAIEVQAWIEGNA